MGGCGSRPVSESRRSRRGNGNQARRNRRGKVLVLAILLGTSSGMPAQDSSDIERRQISHARVRTDTRGSLRDYLREARDAQTSGLSARSRDELHPPPANAQLGIVPSSVTCRHPRRMPTAFGRIFNCQASRILPANPSAKLSSSRMPRSKPPMSSRNI